MRYLAPVPWHAVPPGLVVLDAAGVPRTIVCNITDIGDRRLVLLEGDPNPHYVTGATLITPIELDTADAIVELYVHGLNPVPIENGA